MVRGREATRTGASLDTSAFITLENASNRNSENVHVFWKVRLERVKLKRNDVECACKISVSFQEAVQIRHSPFRG